MNRIQVVAGGLALGLAAILGNAAPTEKEARQSAQQWLSLVDNHKYAESWAAAGLMFRSQITQEQWNDTVEKVRSPLGALVSARSLLKVTLSKTLPGMPDGDYAIVQFRSEFKNKASAVETVTLTMEDGKLRTIGYFIK